MLVDLIRVQTADGIALDGIFQPSDVPGHPTLDAVCLIHGTGSNFYQSSLLEFLAERFLAEGIAVARVNTRGHDGISTAVTNRGGQRLGAAYEIVDDCRHDLLAWTEWLRQKVGSRVGLLGHSLGAVKCLYAAVHEPLLNPHLILAVSPPRLSYSGFCQGPRREEFLEAFHRAEALIQQGQPQALIEVKIPLPLIIAAAGFVEKYGPDERYNFVSLVRRLRCPTWFTFGSQEVADNVAFRGLPDEIEQQRGNRAPVNVLTIPGGDHFYTGVRPALWDQVALALRAR